MDLICSIASCPVGVESFTSVLTSSFHQHPSPFPFFPLLLLSSLRLSSVSTCYSIVASLITSREGDNNNNNNNKSLAQWQRHKELRYSLIIIAACGMPRRTQRWPVRAAAANQLDALPPRPAIWTWLKCNSSVSQSRQGSSKDSFNFDTDAIELALKKFERFGNICPTSTSNQLKLLRYFTLWYFAINIINLGTVGWQVYQVFRAARKWL